MTGFRSDMQVARIRLFEVRAALRASAIEAQDYKYRGLRRKCAAVGRYMQRVGIPTSCTAVSH